MITEDYVSFEMAKLLKERGFDVKCEYCYAEFSKDNIEVVGLSPAKCAQTLKEDRYPYVTLQMAMKWLREVHQIFIRPNTSFHYPIKWYSEIFCYDDNLKTQQDVKTEYYDSPEEACDEAIKYCLENLI